MGHVKDIQSKPSSIALQQTYLPQGFEAYDLLPTGILIYHLENLSDEYSFRVIGFNKAAEIMTGTNLAPCVGKCLEEVFPEIYKTGLPARFAQVINSAKEQDCGDIHYGDNRVAQSVFSVFAVPLPEQRVCVIFKNVTAEWTVRKEIAESREFLQQIINSLADPVFVKDRQHRFVLINRAFSEFVGRSRSELIGKSDYDFFQKDQADVFWGKDEEVFLSQKENVNEETFTDAKHVTHILVTKKMLYTDVNGSQFIVGVIRDVTDIKQAETELKKLNITLEERVKERTAAYDQQTQELARSNEELERFAYVASHDLQEPLRMVGSYVQLLSRRYKGKLGADADEFISFAVNGVSRMKTLINDLLDYSRLGRQPKSMKPVQLNQVLQEVLETLKLSIQENTASVTWTDLPTVHGESLGLAQVFQNIISNALKFRTERSPRIHISVSQQNTNWLISIADNGIGIDQQFREKIFEVFQRLHTADKYPGTGIGLAVCKKIVEHHGGRIWVDGSPGEGATFCFTLPKNEG